MSNSNKRNVIVSAIMTIVTCLSLMAGGTYAWFTDTASTSVTKIQSGNLKVELQYATAWDTAGAPTKWANAKDKTLQFRKAAGHESEEVLWEPGCTYELPQLRVVNKGTLALKYKLVISGINGSDKLNEVIDWTINDAPIALTEGHLLATNASEPFTLKGHMQKNAGDEYQGLSIEGIGITVYAAQYSEESDSYDNTYDSNADYTEVIANGKTFGAGAYTLDTGITATNANAIAVTAGNGANITINRGTFNGGNGGNNACVRANTGSDVTIKGGTFTVGGDANGLGNSVIHSNGGNVTIEGGFFYTKYSYRDKYYVLNQQNGTSGKIIVKGGTFVNYDPATGDDNMGGNFVAEGYKVVTEQHGSDTWYTVVAKQ